MLTIRYCLRQMRKSSQGKKKLQELFKICKFDETQQSLVQYALIEGKQRLNTCAKLGIGTTKYQTMLNEILVQIKVFKDTNPNKFIQIFFE